MDLNDDEKRILRLALRRYLAKYLRSEQNLRDRMADGRGEWCHVEARARRVKAIQDLVTRFDEARPG